MNINLFDIFFFIFNDTVKTRNDLTARCTQPPVLWADEKLFSVQAIHNSQNDGIWIQNLNSVPVEQRTAFRRQKPDSVMVWAGACHRA